MHDLEFAPDAMDGISDMKPMAETDLSAEDGFEIDSLSDCEVDEILDIIQSGRTLVDDLNDPDLFVEHQAGEYTYGETSLGKSAFGVLELADQPARDAVAQRSAGGEDRRLDDDGGHLIAARFDGAPGPENLDAQNRQLNRGPYKTMENEWANELENGDKVFVNAETFTCEDSGRPAAFMGYSITEHPDGSRDWASFSFPNESDAEQAEWGEEPPEPPSSENLEAALADAEYSDFSGADGDL